MKAIAALLIAAASLSGCAIADRSDKFGADLELGLGGFLAYALQIQLKASVGFSKTCPEKEAHDEVEGNRDRLAGGRRGFL